MSLNSELRLPSAANSQPAQVCVETKAAFPWREAPLMFGRESLVQVLEPVSLWDGVPWLFAALLPTVPRGSLGPCLYGEGTASQPSLS